MVKSLFDCKKVEILPTAIGEDALLKRLLYIAFLYRKRWIEGRGVNRQSF
jgi:hypothetical protein